jgi:hypothetical protein
MEVTLEEIAANLVDPNVCKTENWIGGAKWQAKQMYSEEEVRNIVEQTIEKFYKHIYVETKSEMKELWFEQFKKK